MATPTVVARRLDGRTRWSLGWPLPFQLWFPLMVYGVSRLIAAAFMIAAAAPAHRSGYADLATAWDGDWYRLIATQGYPSSLPIGIDGQVEPNAWAFSPVYPLIVRALMAVTGLGYSVVAPSLSLVLGAAAMVVIFVLMQRAVGRFSACACVVLTCTFMAAPVMQLAYAESLALLLLAGALLLLRERKYLGVAALLLLLALTRPVVLAFIPVVIAHGVGRWRGRETDPFSRSDQRAVGFLTVWCVAATGLWPVIVGLVTRDLFAWTKTHEAWRTGPHFASGLGLASFLPVQLRLAGARDAGTDRAAHPRNSSASRRESVGTRASFLVRRLPRISSPRHRSGAERDPVAALGIPADVAVPGGGRDAVRAKVPRDIHSRAGNRRARHAMGLGLYFLGRSSAVLSVSVTMLPLILTPVRKKYAEDCAMALGRDNNCVLMQAP